jgi:Fe-S cluster assembly protein SufB
MDNRINMNEFVFQDLDRDSFDHKNDASYQADFDYGITEDLVRQISKDKNEPEWMLEFRLDSLKKFLEMPMPSFGPDLKDLDFSEIVYYAKASDVKNANDWDKVPSDIKKTFERLGIPEAEHKFLAGVGAQYESEVVYHSLKKEWEDLGVIFEDCDVALQKHPEIFKKYFMKCVPNNDHKFAALHGAVWSGGTFLYIPKGVKLDQPLQAYFRMNAPSQGQFEHTLIIVEDDCEVGYIEGCSAPKYGKNALHAGCVEIFVAKNSKVRYSSVENWSKDTYNLNTKRAIVGKDSVMEWVGGNMGSGVTMLYPCSILKGQGARADHLGIAFANAGQFQDTGAKVICAAKDTKVNIVMKSLSKGGGISSYRGLLQVNPNAENVTASVECDALILDEISRSDTYPDMKIYNDNVTIAHEAKTGKLNAEDIFYLTSRGISEEEAKAMIINGFLEPIIKELPMEYAVEMNRLIELEMEGSVG